MMDTHTTQCSWWIQIKIHELSIRFYIVITYSRQGVYEKKNIKGFNDIPSLTMESMCPGYSIRNVQNKVLSYYGIWLYCGIRKNHFPLCWICRTTIVKISIFKTWTTIQEANAQSTSSNTTRTISCKGWNAPVEYRQLRKQIRYKRVRW